MMEVKYFAVIFIGFNTPKKIGSSLSTVRINVLSVKLNGGGVGSVTFAVLGMFLILSYLDPLFLAPKVWTCDCSFTALDLVLKQVIQRPFDSAPKLTVLARMWNFLNHLVGKGICSIFEHWSSASWTSCHAFSAGFAQDMTSRAGW